MDRVDLTSGEPRWSELVERAEAGEIIEIMRDGRLTAQLVPAGAARKPIDIEGLRALRATLPVQQESAAGLIREMRDSGY